MRRCFLNTMILSARDCFTTSANTAALSTKGEPMLADLPLPIISTSDNSTMVPGSPASFSTTMVSSLATRYCFPPVRMTANI